MAHAIDSTTIDLCLNLFPWAKFRKAKGAVKMHTLLDLRGSIPTFIDANHIYFGMATVTAGLLCNIANFAKSANCKVC